MLQTITSSVGPSFRRWTRLSEHEIGRPRYRPTKNPITAPAASIPGTFPYTSQPQTLELVRWALRDTFIGLAGAGIQLVQFSLFTVGQEGGVDFVKNEPGLVDNFINEFFVKPDDPNGVMINSLVDQFTTYYKPHNEKTILYYRDRYGDSRNPNVNKSASYNDQAIARLERAGWTIIQEVHRLLGIFMTIIHK